MAPRKKLSASERRAQLIEVGRAAFADKGFAAVSAEEIADRAQVSKPILYQHFGGKEGLYAVIVDREMENLVGIITEAISAGRPREQLERAATSFLRYVADNPDGFAVLSHDMPAGAGEGSLSSVLNELAGRVGRVFASEFKKAGYDPRYAPLYANALVGMVTFVSQWWVAERKPSIEVVASHVSALAWMGLRNLPRKPGAVDRGRERRGSGVGRRSPR